MSFSWTSETLGTARPWVDVCHNGSFYVAVAYGTAIAGKSPDGLTWTEHALPVSSNWISVIWSPELALFCAVSYTSGTIAATSPDGETWTARTLPTAAQWVDVAWNGTVFCAVADGPGTDAATSPDGITWTLRTLPASVRWSAICWTGTKFVAISQSTDAATSADGITWVSQTLPSSDNWAYMAWNGSTLCAVSFSTDNAITSADGVTWAAQTLPTVSGWSNIAASTRSGLFCAIGFPTGTASATSPDGATWTSATLPASDDWAAVTAGTHDFVALGTTTAFGLAIGGANPDPNVDVSAALASTDRAVMGLGAGLSDALSASDTLTPEVLANLIDRLNATGSLDGAWTLVGNISDALSYRDTVLAAWQLLLSDSVATLGDAVGTAAKIAAIADALTATGLASNSLTAFTACVEAIALEGIIRLGFQPDVVDAGTLSDAALTTAKLLAPAVDSLLASDDASPMLRISVVGSETLAFSDPVDALLRANLDLSDQLLLYVTLRLDGLDYVGWALNTDSKAASRYSNTPFDSFASHKGKDYAAGPLGLALFTGRSVHDTDDGTPVAASLRTFLTDFASSRSKRVPDAFVGVATDGSLVLKVITRDPATGARTEDWYRVDRLKASGQPEQGSVAIGRGLKSTWWAVELANVDGAALDLDRIELRPLVLDRRT